MSDENKMQSEFVPGLGQVNRLPREQQNLLSVASEPIQTNAEKSMPFVVKHGSTPHNHAQTDVDESVAATEGLYRTKKGDAKKIDDGSGHEAMTEDGQELDGTEGAENMTEDDEGENDGKGNAKKLPAVTVDSVKDKSVVMYGEQKALVIANEEDGTVTIKSGDRLINVSPDELTEISEEPEVVTEEKSNLSPEAELVVAMFGGK
jgi:flagellar hook assembly protein FlgD